MTKKSKNIGEPHENPDKLFCVGIGASAGGLEAIEVFFKNMPENTGMAFVVVQHLSPDYKSLMMELLSRHTKMPIHRVEDNMIVKHNNIYLIPPQKKYDRFWRTALSYRSQSWNGAKSSHRHFFQVAGAGFW